jgi:polysaccharide biosynthesis protein PslG
MNCLLLSSDVIMMGLKNKLKIVSSILTFVILGLPLQAFSATMAPTALFPEIRHYPGLAFGSKILSLSSSAQDVQLDKAVSLGVQRVRVDFEWKNIQPRNDGKYNWAYLDAFVAKVNARKLKILGIIDYAPAWAAGPCAAGTNCPPANPEVFGAFAGKVAERYRGMGVINWEIWNEPNNAFFWGGKADCNAYSANLKAANIAIKKVVPGAGIISGGMSPASTDGKNISPTDFLSCMYRNGVGRYFDALGHHPYTFPLLASTKYNAWAQMSTMSTNLRSIMIANGDAGKRIWLTEFGAPTSGPNPAYYVSEAMQSTLMADALKLYGTYDWAGPIFWYTFQDSGTSKTTNENFFGLLRYDGSEKPAFTTYKNAIKAGL